ncbi:MAG TPA: pyridoxamine 5'-phosphate oxidase family protein [Acidimicrobiia bacterium]|nr:pyridoxamine 5'-phosphate oxidase family protein [Acidimicrobiia bacterium]
MDDLTREESLALLDESKVAHLGVVSDGEPYVTPMSFVRDGETLLFRTVPGRKLEALRNHPSVCIEVSSFDDETGDWVSVIVTGTAAEVLDSATKQRAIDGLFRRYSSAIGDPLRPGGLQPLPRSSHVVGVTIEKITGLSSGRGFSPRTRPGRL